MRKGGGAVEAGSHGGGIGIAFLFCSWDVDRFFLRPGVEDRARDGRGAHGPNRGANDVRSTEASSGDDVRMSNSNIIV